MIAPGSPAPDFTAESSTGSKVTLSALRGRAVVIYFYPKAFTPICAREARLFRDNYDELRALGAEVLGISVDDAAVQCRFAEQMQVKFPLLADPDRAISRAYGVLWPVVPVDKRVTVVVDEQGVVRAVFRHELQVLKHLDDVLNFLKKRKS